MVVAISSSSLILLFTACCTKKEKVPRVLVSCCLGLSEYPFTAWIVVPDAARCHLLALDTNAAVNEDDACCKACSACCELSIPTLYVSIKQSIDSGGSCSFPALQQRLLTAVMRIADPFKSIEHALCVSSQFLPHLLICPCLLHLLNLHHKNSLLVMYLGQLMVLTDVAGPAAAAVVSVKWNPLQMLCLQLEC